MKQKTIAVIGLGSFGTTVAKMLASMNHEVLGVLMKRRLKHWH